MDDVKVRIGVPQDMEGVMDLALQVCEENGIFQPNVYKIAADIWPSLHQDRGVVGVIGKPGERIEGFVLLRIGTMWYADNAIIEEKTVYVHPDFRSAPGGRATKLGEFSKQVADELGFPLIIGVLSNNRTKSKVKMYERLFGEPAGAFFLYGAQTGQWKEDASD